MKRFVLAAAVFLAVLLSAPWTGLAGGAAGSAWKKVDILPDSAGGGEAYFDVADQYGGYITTDAKGNLYVMDAKRIVRFTPEGALDTAWGKGGFISPREPDSPSDLMFDGLAADSRGRVYVLCETWEQATGEGPIFLVKRYRPDGALDKSWLHDGMTGREPHGHRDEREGAMPCFQGSIAVDSEDNLCFLGVYDGVYRFASDGKVEKLLELNGFNIAVMDKKDRVYAFNGEDGSASSYTLDGKKLKGYDTSELKWDIQFDAEGSMYCLNDAQNIIRKFTPDMKPDTSWGSEGVKTGARVGGYESKMLLVTADNKNNLYVLEGANVVRRYTKDGAPDTKWGHDGVAGNAGSIRHHISDISTDGQGNYYVLDRPDGYMSTVWRYGRDWQPDMAWKENVLEASKTDRFIPNTYDIEADGTGRLYLAAFSGLRRLDAEGNNLSVLKIYNNMFKVDNNNYIYASQGNALLRYTPDGAPDTGWGQNGRIKITWEAHMFELEIGTDHALYLLDDNNSRITKYSPQGVPDTSWDGAAIFDNGTNGSVDGPFAIDEAGNLYVAYSKPILDGPSQEYVSEAWLARFGSDGSPDTSWCPNGESRLPGTSANPSDPAALMVADGKLYAVWNGELYVMDEKLARVGERRAWESAETASAWWLVGIIAIAGLDAGLQARKGRAG
jgi:uncharacterized delta-60 repeat protein